MRDARPRRWASTVVVVLLAVVAAACGEQEPDIDVPAREQGQVVLDLADVLDDEVDRALRAFEDTDVVAITYETPQANAGEAFRAGQRVLEEWDADVVLVAVAEPGDFTSETDDRRRFFGATPADVRAVSADLREELADVVVPVHTVDNEWSTAFVAAAERLAEELE